MSKVNCHCWQTMHEDKLKLHIPSTFRSYAYWILTMYTCKLQILSEIEILIGRAIAKDLKRLRYHLFTCDCSSTEMIYVNNVVILTRASITIISMRGQITVATVWLELVPNITVNAEICQQEIVAGCSDCKDNSLRVTCTQCPPANNPS